MKRVLVLGCGKIGYAVAVLLTQIGNSGNGGDYDVYAADGDESKFPLMRTVIGSNNVKATAHVQDWDDTLFPALKFDYLVNCLPYRHTIHAAKWAVSHKVNYLDLTEDRESTSLVEAVADAGHGIMFAPQCGLAPGFINILGHGLARKYPDLRTLRMRVGSLPEFPVNPPLNYNQLWSIEGLVNEYLSPCQAIQRGRIVETEPLESVEQITVAGRVFEAFNTSGGLGSMCSDLSGLVRDMDYKSIRYPGHRDAVVMMRDILMMDENEMREAFRKVPATDHDIVLVYVAAMGRKHRGPLPNDPDPLPLQPMQSEVWATVLRPVDHGPHRLLAIQASTASGVCGVLDMHANGQLPQVGLLRHADVHLDEFLQNRFGAYYKFTDRA